MIKRLIVIILFIYPAMAISATKVTETRSILKKWGLAYCLSSNEQLKKEAGLARGGYFQLGSHDDEAAYVKVRGYFDAYLKKSRLVGQQSGEELTVMKCLDAYERPDYDRLIKEQDRYISQ
ncbi:hypothetical protein ACFQNF_10045 [Iodobacter arcticus]|uniref:Type VI secretion protein n=1 Tax=Iodobacter arcticus TaxID=590593 RepID=A0ABW2R2I4_9NEIS|nr:hypothetical protein [Janthinobacterium sp. B9-8]AMC35367.1 hypothetical protein VN23_12470 [Janthinobacterium sp. B9-8]